MTTGRYASSAEPLTWRRHLAEHPRRIGPVAAFEIAALICLVVACLAVAVNAAAWAVEHFQQKAPAYVAGLVAGAVVGYFSRDLLKASDGVTVAGWNRAARAQRAATFDAELRKIPWNPNPNGDPEATAISGA